ncbi:MAG TPA: hypothetical protein PKC49_00875 [Phycisphaerae bacterium]|nr:hypothetical protein [Phycisphaerae bacterium]
MVLHERRKGTLTHIHALAGSTVARSVGEFFEQKRHKFQLKNKMIRTLRVATAYLDAECSVEARDVRHDLRAAKRVLRAKELRLAWRALRRDHKPKDALRGPLSALRVQPQPALDRLDFDIRRQQLAVLKIRALERSVRLHEQPPRAA